MGSPSKAEGREQIRILWRSPLRSHSRPAEARGIERPSRNGFPAPKPSSLAAVQRENPRRAANVALGRIGSEVFSFDPPEKIHWLIKRAQKKRKIRRKSPLSDGAQSKAVVKISTIKTSARPKVSRKDRLQGWVLRPSPSREKKRANPKVR